jgi:hypothetical protein
VLVTARQELGSDRDYDPFGEEPALFRRFAAIEPGDRDGILAFANRFGCLGGFAKTVRPDEPVPSHPLLIGELLTDWVACQHQFRNALRLVELVKSGSEAELRKRFKMKRSRRGTYEQVEWSYIRRRRDDPEPTSHPFYVLQADILVGDEYELDIRWAARMAIAEELSKYLRGEYPGLRYGDGVRPCVEPAPHAFGFSLQFQPPNLITAMWLQFTLSLTGNKQHRTCRFCGEWFEVAAGEDARTARREFCGDSCKVREHRGRKLKAIELAEAGASVRRIAKETGTEEKTVRGWVKGIKKKGGGRGT